MLEVTEVAIIDLQDREDWKGGLPNGDLVDLKELLSSYYSLLRWQEMFLRQKSRI